MVNTMLTALTNVMSTAPRHKVRINPVPEVTVLERSDTWPQPEVEETEKSDTEALRLQWNNLSFQYPIKKKSLASLLGSPEEANKMTLRNHHGEIVGGTLTALMGPSGAGKSTLLNCITGRYLKGVSGDIQLSYPGSAKEVSIAFVPQKDALYNAYTVKETLLFASKMKNPSDTDHRKQMLKVLKSLNLEVCMNTKLGKCSGGQRKRVSIGVELISNPDVLVLDEPTSGLDSDNAVLCITLLKEVACTKGMAIVSTIHQPNTEVFNCFDQLYLISRHGENIFFGPPSKVVSHFAVLGLKCSKQCSVADFAIDIAYGKFEPADKNTSRDYHVDLFVVPENHYQKPIAEVIESLKEKKTSHFNEIFLVGKRSFEMANTRSVQLVFRFCLSVATALMLSKLWEVEPGVEDGCWESGKNKTDREMLEFHNDLLEVLQQSFKGSDSRQATREAFQYKMNRIQDNTTILFTFALYVVLVHSVSAVLIFPAEMATVKKEIGNHWYKGSSYIIGKTIAEIPGVILATFVYFTLMYKLTEQINEPWRFWLTYLFVALVTITAETCGTLIGIFFCHNLEKAVLTAIFFVFPSIMFSGYLVRCSKLPFYFKPVAVLNFPRYGFESIISIIYGFGRCNSTEVHGNFVDDLVAANNPYDIVADIYGRFNIKSSDMRRFAPVVGIEEDVAVEVFEAAKGYLKVRDAFATNEGAALQPSYVLDFMDVRDTDVPFNLIALIGFLVVAKLATYFALRAKTCR